MSSPRSRRATWRSCWRGRAAGWRPTSTWTTGRSAASPPGPRRWPPSPGCARWRATPALRDGGRDRGAGQRRGGWGAAERRPGRSGVDAADAPSPSSAAHAGRAAVRAGAGAGSGTAARRRPGLPAAGVAQRRGGAALVPPRRPDARFHLRADGVVYDPLLEWDRGLVRRRDYARKLASYAAYFAARPEAPDGVPRLLLVTTTAAEGRLSGVLAPLRARCPALAVATRVLTVGMPRGPGAGTRPGSVGRRADDGWRCGRCVRLGSSASASTIVGTPARWESLTDTGRTARCRRHPRVDRGRLPSPTTAATRGLPPGPMVRPPPAGPTPRSPAGRLLCAAVPCRERLLNAAGGQWGAGSPPGHLAGAEQGIHRPGGFLLHLWPFERSAWLSTV
jgi:hypothetical protein